MNGVAAIHPAVQEAIEWEVRLRGGDVSQPERDQFDAWRRADPAHEDAWARLQERLARLQALQRAPSVAVRRALNEPSHARRRVLKAGAGFATLVMAGIGTRELVRVYSLDADYHNGNTAPEKIALSDGRPMTLGASARVYAAEDNSQGHIYLAAGQIATGGTRADSQALVVKTRDGIVRTDSARLSVDALRLHTVVAVQGGDATLLSHAGEPVHASDGSVWSLSPRRIARMPETSSDIFAWTHGTLVVLDRAVPDVVETLGRYYNGYIRFPQAALSRRVSGVFPLDDPTAALRQLAEGLGLSLKLYGNVLAVASKV
ncbi:DUF4880 domain-containing protein [Trinickia dinghuensis]|uniref:DUF4880 domain-containing protein n=1 Tax=Trinickia dinghuensis TaxID=2291023 RepID=A0A3D8JQ44_9BURK|nr:DUF4880 domain-containing protein [Trinickia dinghuensis]RDU95137.1 DUF4880 domain-containing protein [Trinickia dinghuensis]